MRTVKKKWNILCGNFSGGSEIRRKGSKKKERKNKRSGVWKEETYNKKEGN